MKPIIIGIAGESGVGKSTIAEAIAMYYGPERVLVLSTDDLHKYSRNDPAWQTTTHLHPDANNLAMGDAHLSTLRNGWPIYRSVYNHQTGHFNAPIEIAPKPIIIIEGLHAFYTPISRDFIDIKIYLETDETLRTYWKVKRDTCQRGYDVATVLDTIERRKTDSILISEKQKANADAIFTISIKEKSNTNNPDPLQDASIEITQTFIKENEYDYIINNIFFYIKEYLHLFDLFIKTCQTVGKNIEFCQAAGGNVSVKTPAGMLIKASGVPMKQVTRISGFAIVNQEKILPNISTDEALNIAIEESKQLPDKHPRPSMETGFHALLPGIIVLHAHPVYLTLLLCLHRSKEIISELFVGYDYEYIPYANPGCQLHQAMAAANLDKQIYFLENHGVIIQVLNNDAELTMLILEKLNNAAKEYLKNHHPLLEDFILFNLNFCNIHVGNWAFQQYSFPDAVIFSHRSKEVKAVEKYIQFIGNQIQNGVRPLSKENIEYIKNMEAEKYRQQV